jgi:Transposase DDE domain
MDRGYDNNRVYDECHARRIAPVIPPRKGRAQPETPIQRGTSLWGDLYRRRTSVEREFGRLKHYYGLAFLRVRGIQRVRQHADLCILARLALALNRRRASVLAAA